MSGIRHFSDRQYGRRGPGGVAAGRFHRVDGYRASRKAWICIACRAWHDTKPKECIAPDCLSGDFFLFDSKGEALRFLELWSQQDYGLIVPGTLEHHPRYALNAPAPGGGPPITVAHYVADASYVRTGGERVVEDWKPGRDEALDPVFNLKRRWFEAQYTLPITIMSEAKR